MNAIIKTDVIIVGAGPTGLSMACQLVRYGIDFVIIDRKATLTTHSKAIGVQARTLEIYEQLGVAKEALGRGQIAGKIQIVSGGKIRGGVDLSAMGEGLSPYPYLFILDQSKNEQLLYEYLQSHQREVRWQTELEQFTQDERGVIAQVKTADGISESIEAKYLVGGDGAKSPVRHSLGLTFEGSTFERLFYVADAQVDWDFSHDGGYGCFSRSSVALFFPMVGEKRYRIIGTFPEGLEKDEGEILYAEIEQRIKEDTQLSLDISHVNWFSVYKVHTRAVNKFSVGRCFVAGDAAHIHSPAGGQGMNTGIQDVYNLAWKMAFVIKVYAEAKLLETYNEERLPNAQRLLATTDRAFNVLVGSNWFFSLIRLKILPLVAKYAMGRDFVGKAIFSLMSQIRISYPQATLSQRSDDDTFKIQAGDRMPYFLIAGESIYDQLHQPKFHFITFSTEPDDFQSLNPRFVARYAELIDFQTIPLEPNISKVFGSSSSFSVLLRPDNYVAFISAKDPLEDLTKYLSRFFTDQDPRSISGVQFTLKQLEFNTEVLTT
jgi:2-polyprenyl-6-methoxyphenol hydroxylase-like FAD-dependent oxidoreductase